MVRADQRVEDTWDLTYMYSNQDEISGDEKLLESLSNELLRKKTEFLKTTNDFNSYMDKYFQVHEIAGKLLTYASHQLDQDLQDDENNKLLFLLERKIVKIQKELSFVKSLLIKNKTTIEVYLKDLINEDYRPFFTNLFRLEPYILSEKEENIIAATAIINDLPHSVYSTLVDTEIDYGTVVKDGEKIKLTSANYGTFLTDSSRSLRREAFSKTYEQFQKYNNTLASLYIGQLQSANFFVKVQNYPSSITKSLYTDDVKVAIYLSLIKAISNNVKINHQYMKVRKQILGYDDLHLYDLYVPLLEENDQKIEFAQAQTTTYKALAILGKEYQDVLDELFTNRWIDRFPNQNKRSGAYSGGSYKSPAYILLNYDNQLNDLYTLVHEIGHSVHTVFSDRNNSFQNSKYKIFIAEIASTVNELLLTYYLLENSSSKSEKAYYLNYLLEQFRTTVFRQTMFAEFEMETHHHLEEGLPLTAQVLNELYFTLNQKYFGDEVYIDSEIQYEWGRIPHFYYDFYVYKYATSFCIATVIAEKIYKEKTGYLEKYLQFLKTGNSKTPQDTLKIMDIDVTNPAVFESAMNKYNIVLKEFEELMKNEI